MPGSPYARLCETEVNPQMPRNVLPILAVVLLAACQRGGMMMNTDQMMNQMRNNPEMMRTMMDQMMRDPQMHQQMMDQMMKNPQQWAPMMARMMDDPNACQVMADAMAKNPERCRNMMKAMADRMDPASGQQMMQHCGAMNTSTVQ